MATSKIEWTETTWNPTTGCTKISSGCTNCYAERMSARLKAMGVKKYKNQFKLTIHPNELKQPYNWNKPRMVFVNSMSDLFHEAIPVDFIKDVFKVMNENPKHIFQILTKRAENLYRLNSILNWTSNIWMGVSVEDYTQLNRIDFLKYCNSNIKFLSLEPLLTPLTNLNLDRIDWVIVGGESGPKARPLRKEWVLDIKENCIQNNIPFFFKQWGGKNKKKAGRILEGRTYNEMPEYNKERNLVLQ